jgi:hypothetical protein
MTTPTQVHHNLRELEVERLNDEVKRRISELQLKILSGTLSDEDLKKTGDELAYARKQLLENIDTTLREQTGRRVRSEEQNRARTA